MRVFTIYIDSHAPAIVPTPDVTTIEEITVDGEPAIRLTVSGGTQYTTKKSVALPVILWE